jgi:hypothetical protein
MAPLIKQQVWDVDPDHSITVVNSMEGVLYDWAAPRRFNISILGYFAGGDPRVDAGISLGRLVHNAYRIEMRGDSMR